LNWEITLFYDKITIEVHTFRFLHRAVPKSFAIPNTSLPPNARFAINHHLISACVHPVIVGTVLPIQYIKDGILVLVTYLLSPSKTILFTYRSHCLPITTTTTTTTTTISHHLMLYTKMDAFHRLMRLLRSRDPYYRGGNYLIEVPLFITTMKFPLPHFGGNYRYPPSPPCMASTTIAAAIHPPTSTK
jgi:hypothetical protein